MPEQSLSTEPSRIRRKLAVSTIDQVASEEDEVKPGSDLVSDPPFDEAPFPLAAVPEPQPAPASAAKRAVLTVSLICLATLTGVADSQLAKQAYSANFNAPFLMMYTSQFVRVLTFPLFLLTTCGVARTKRKPFSFQAQIKKRLLLFGPNGPTILSVLKIVCVLGISNLVGLGLYLSSLRFISASESTTLMTSQVAMIYIISVIFLRQPVLVFKLFATLLSFTGVALTAYAKGFQSDSITGVGIALATAVTYAASQVYLKVVLNRPNLGQICLYMSCTATFVLLIGWVFPLCMKITGIENWEFDTAPWLVVIGSGVASLLTAVIINYGISIASPFLMSLYNLIRIPINNLIDTYARGQSFSELEIIGAVCIGIGFLLIVVPDDRVSIRIRQRLNDIFQSGTKNLEPKKEADLTLPTGAAPDTGVAGQETSAV